MININDIENKKILLIDDEVSILEMLETVLLKEGFKKIYKAENGEKGIKIFQEINPDLVVLDIMLPTINGFEVCRKMRDKSYVPIIFLSAKNEDTDKLLGLGIGGDDYITKPFSPKEVAFRIKAYFRRMEYTKSSSNSVITFGNVEINEAKGEITKSGKMVSLTAKEYNLLLYLAKNMNYVISKKNLYEAIWNEPYLGSDNALMVHIRHLREKIEDNPEKPEHIITLKGLGYKLRKQDN